MASFAAQVEALDSLPLTTTTRQVADAEGDLPRTLLQVGKAAISGDDCPVNSIRLTLPVTVHHIRQTAPDGGTSGLSGTETALSVMSALAVFIENDYRLESVAAAGDTFSLERAMVTDLDSGDDNPVQRELDAADQNDQVACSLGLMLTWTEDRYD